jgi:L-iditol 2-dehydrogenase
MMKTSIMTGIGQLAFTEREIPIPKAHEVLVKMEYVGMCGSDMHFYKEGRIGNMVVEPPLVLGHEAGGIVTAVGGNVTHLKPGDAVALEPGIPCRACDACLEGRYNLCPDVRFFACPPVDGTFCEYIAHDAALCFKLPDNVSTLEGALIEPLAVGLFAAHQVQAKLGKTAAVLGCGCIGLCSMMALKSMGVTKVYMIDFLENRLKKALELGADVAVNSKTEDLTQAIMKLTAGQGVDLVIDAASGEKGRLHEAVAIVKKGGRIALVGYTEGGEADFPLTMAIRKEIAFESVFRYRHMYPLAIEAAASGKINLKGVATHFFTFDELPAAIERCINEKAEIVKAVIKFISTKGLS